MCNIATITYSYPFFEVTTPNEYLICTTCNTSIYNYNNYIYIYIYTYNYVYTSIIDPLIGNRQSTHTCIYKLYVYSLSVSSYLV